MTWIWIGIYLIGAFATLWFCMVIGLKPRQEPWSTLLVFFGWPGTLIALAVIAVCAHFKVLGCK